jgi:ABC-type branched-subunit amino acid transport system substrate-binding protein
MLRWSRVLIALLALAVLAAGCRTDDAAAPADDPADPAAEPAEPDDAEADDADAEVTAEGPGISDEPCPDAVNEDNGCIYLGVMSDFTEGPFSASGPAIQQAQEAFWQRVNEEGGIGGYDIDNTTHVRDNLYQPETQAEVFEEIRGEILAVATSLGSPTTNAIAADLDEENLVTVPVAWNSEFAFEDFIAESGPNYCVESMNAVDYFVEQLDGSGTVMSVHFPTDFGQDAAVGARIAAEENGLEFASVPTPPGADNQAEAISAIVSQSPDLVVLTTGPTEAAAIIGQAAAQGFQGRVIGSAPTWNVALLQTPAAPALEALYLVAAPFESYGVDTPGHEAMREAMGDVQGSDFYTAGWVSQYPLRDALQAAADAGDLSREGVRAAYQSLTEVDYEGMQPEGAGNFAGEPNERIVRQSVISEPDPEAPAGITTIQDWWSGPTAEEHDFTEPCLAQY